MNKNFVLSILGLFVMTMSSYSQAEQMNPIAGAKLYFCDKPFTNSNAGNKTSFTSGNFIYGRLELDKQTIQQAFNMTTEEHHHYYIRYRVMVFKNGEEIGQHQTWDYIYIKKGDQKNTALNFDVLPEPNKATTTMSSDGWFKGSVATGPLYQQIRPDMFRENGEYTIKVRFFLESYNAWGNINPVSQWPMVQDEFKFHFDGKDVKTILNNYNTANEMITARKNKMAN